MIRSHTFDRNGRRFVINIEQMTASEARTETDALPQKPAIPLLTDTGILPTDPPGAFGTTDRRKEPSGDAPSGKRLEPVVNMGLFLTQTCNLKCIYCYGDGGSYGSGGDIAEETAFRAVDWLMEQSCSLKRVHMGFFGGEPFLKFPLMKSVVAQAQQKAEAANKRISFHVTTNATLLDDEQIEFVQAHGIRVMVSFDGTKALQDTQRPYAGGKGSYDSTLPRIRKLLAQVPGTPGHTVIVGDTDPQRVKDAMCEIGFTQVTVTHTSPSLFEKGAPKEKPWRNTGKLLQECEDEADTWIELVRNRDVIPLRRLRDRSVLFQGIVSLLHQRKKYYGCGAGHGLVAVSCSGDVYLCHRFVGQDKFRLGSIFDKTLQRDAYLENPIVANETCAACFAKYYCGGGCRHDHIGCTGYATRIAEDICRLRRRELELAAAVVGSLGPEDLALLTAEGILPPKPCPFDFV